MLGIEIAHSKHLISKTNTNNSLNVKSNLPKSEKNFLILKTIFITLSILLVVTYIGGIFEESQRTTFKIIQEPAEANLINNTIFIAEDNHAYQLYAIVYENKDVYILCQLSKNDSGIFIDHNFQKIIPKDNQATYCVDNIYKLPK